jgi:hypothetical protein
MKEYLASQGSRMVGVLCVDSTAWKNFDDGQFVQAECCGSGVVLHV